MIVFIWKRICSLFWLLLLGIHLSHIFMCCLFWMQVAQVTERVPTDILADKNLNLLMVTCSQKLYLGPWSSILPHCLLQSCTENFLRLFSVFRWFNSADITSNLLFYPPWLSQLLRARELIKDLWILVAWYRWLLVNGKKRVPKMFAAVWQKQIQIPAFFKVISCPEGKFPVRQSVLPEAVESSVASLSFWGEESIQ